MSTENQPICHGIDSKSCTGRCGDKPLSIGKARAHGHLRPPSLVLSMVKRWLHLEASHNEKPTLSWAEVL